MKDDAAIRVLHAEYVRLTGLDVALSLPRMFAWEQFMVRGFTGGDLAQVVRLRRIKARERGPALAFHWLVEDLDHFEEDLAEARARARKCVHAPDKARVLQVTGRCCEPKTCEARTPAQIMAGNRALDELRKLRDSL